MPKTNEIAFNVRLLDVLQTKHLCWRDYVGVEQRDVLRETALQPDIVMRHTEPIKLRFIVCFDGLVGGFKVECWHFCFTFVVCCYLAGNSKTILDNLLFVYAPKNTIRLKKGQFALGDGRLMLLSTKTEQVHSEKLV